MRERTKQIRDFILENVKEHPKDIAAFTAKQFDISRQAVNKHLVFLTDEAKIEVKGSRNKRVYLLKKENSFMKEYRLPGIDESLIFARDLSNYVENLPQNITMIIDYVFTELANNANDHSEGSKLSVHSFVFDKYFFMFLEDDGIGIFQKIAKALNLPDDKLAILELAKGKFTTDPENHSGEGIFFSTKLSDMLLIQSGNVSFRHNLGGKYEDYISDDNFIKGTRVAFSISLDSGKTLKEIFDKYSDDEYGFTKTVVNVELLRIGNENLISRSQAKRLIARFEQFRHVVLDFTNVDMIGQAFADEVFRVFQRKYPDIVLEPINTTPDVDKMISRAKVKLCEMENNQ